MWRTLNTNDRSGCMNPHTIVTHSQCSRYLVYRNQQYKLNIISYWLLLLICQHWSVSWRSDRMTHWHHQFRVMTSHTNRQTCTLITSHDFTKKCELTQSANVFSFSCRFHPIGHLTPSVFQSYELPLTGLNWNQRHHDWKENMWRPSGYKECKPNYWKWDQSLLTSKTSSVHTSKRATSNGKWRLKRDGRWTKEAKYTTERKV